MQPCTVRTVSFRVPCKAKRALCHSTSDENKAFVFKARNRRAPIKPTEGPSENLINAISELNKGRPSPNQSTKTVFGPDQLSWKQVDEAVNKYPSERVFTAIGEGSEDFQRSMVECVEQALQCEVGEDKLLVRPSKGGKYVSVKIGPMMVSHAGEVVDVYGRMKEDERMKWFF